MGQREWSQQPAPHRSLMVSGIAFPRPSSILPFEPRFEWPQAAQPVGCEQLRGDDIHHGFLLHHGKRTYGKGKRKNLVGTQGTVLASRRRVDHVVTTASLRVPKL